MTSSERAHSLILVVDHDPAILEKVASVLARPGLACHCCLTAEEAVQLAPLLQPDLILADVSLHGTSGLEMCAEIKQAEGLAEVPVMFFSAGQIPDIIRRREGQHGIYYLRKPFDAAVLLQLIDGTLEAKRAGRLHVSMPLPGESPILASAPVCGSLWPHEPVV